MRHADRARRGGGPVRRGELRPARHQPQLAEVNAYSKRLGDSCRSLIGPLIDHIDDVRQVYRDRYEQSLRGELPVPTIELLRRTLRLFYLLDGTPANHCPIE